LSPLGLCWCFFFASAASGKPAIVKSTALAPPKSARWSSRPAARRAKIEGVLLHHLLLFGNACRAGA
jgi:hypothetical protein